VIRLIALPLRLPLSLSHDTSLLRAAAPHSQTHPLHLVLEHPTALIFDFPRFGEGCRRCMTNGCIRRHCQGPLYPRLESRHLSPKRQKNHRGSRPTIPRSRDATFHLPHSAFPRCASLSFVPWVMGSHNSGFPSGHALKTRPSSLVFTNRRNSPSSSHHESPQLGHLQDWILHTNLRNSAIF
jgi:hypothetical protein